MRKLALNFREHILIDTGLLNAIICHDYSRILFNDVIDTEPSLIA
jgi:hypothetical protein